MSTHLFLSPQLGRYGFPEGHPLSVDRQGAFWRGACARGLDRRVTLAQSPEAPKKAIRRFHTMEYIDRVIAASRRGSGYLDYGDTPAFPGCYEIAAHVVGAALEGARRIMAGIKTSAVINVGTATIAAFIGAGGFGERISQGLALNDHAVLLAGALPAAALALAVHGLFEALERSLPRPPR